MISVTFPRFWPTNSKDLPRLSNWRNEGNVTFCAVGLFAEVQAIKSSLQANLFNQTPDV